MDTATDPRKPESTGNGPPFIGSRNVPRAHWEVFAALALMVFVLAVLDVVAIGSPVLVVSCAPLAFLMATALFPPGRWALAGWSGAFAGMALVFRDPAFLGMVLPVAVIGLLSEVHRRWRGPP